MHLEDPHEHDGLAADNNAGQNGGSGESVAPGSIEENLGVNLLTTAALAYIKTSNERWVFATDRVVA